MICRKPSDKAIFLRGQHDGERGLPPHKFYYSEREKEIYERGYGAGYDIRYRREYNLIEFKRHGSFGKQRPDFVVQKQ